MADVEFWFNPDGGGSDLGTQADPWLLFSTAWGNASFRNQPGNRVILHCEGTSAHVVASQIVLDNDFLADEIIVLGASAQAEGLNTSELRIVTNDVRLFLIRNIQVPLLKFQGLQFVTNSTAANSYVFMNPSGNPVGFGKLRFRDCRFELNHESSALVSLFENGDADANDNIFVNCMFRRTGAGVGTCRAIRQGNSGAIVKVYNSFVSGAFTDGLHQINGGVVKNTCIEGCVNSVTFTNVTSSNNYSDDGAGDAGFTNVVDWSTYVTNVSAGDYSLVVSSPLETGGVNVSGENGDGDDGLTLGVTVGVNGVEHGGIWSSGVFAVFDVPPPSILNIDGDDSVSQYQNNVLVNLSDWTETPILSVTLGGESAVLVEDNPLDDQITINIPGTLLTGTYDLVVSSTTENDTLNDVSYTQTHPYPTPAPGNYDSNSIWAGSTFPALSYFREVSGFSTLVFGNGFTGWDDSPTENDVNDYLVAPPGFEGADSATLEVLTSLGTTAQLVINATVESGEIILSIDVVFKRDIFNSTYKKIHTKVYI